MPTIMILFIAFAVVLRFATLAISIRNENRMKAAGAVEHEAKTSTLLALTHVVFYLCAIFEGITTGAPVTALSTFGMILYGLSMVALFWVIRTLGRFWTVKIIFASDHVLVTNRFFRAVRHPNYFLNIIPELIGFALALSAYWTLIIGLPIYLVVLYQRIRQEEAVMSNAFEAY